jgi:hypothetical protein
MRDNKERADHRTSRSPRSRAYLRTSGLAVLLTAAALTLGACGRGPASPHVASLGTSTTLASNQGTSGGSTTTTQTAVNPTQLLNGWATCMRGHGDPNQADPTIDTNKVIHLTWDPAIPGGYLGTEKGGQGNVGPGQYCRTYLTKAQSALRGDQGQQVPSQAQFLQVAECMRANGIPDFPDPTDSGLSLSEAPGIDLNPDNPTFQSASKLCAQKTGVHLPGAGGSPPAGTIEINGGGLPGAGSSANG